MQKKKMSTKDICQRLIDTHKDRVSPRDESYLTPAQRDIYQAVVELARSDGSRTLEYHDIKDKYKGGLLPSDFCYNLVNIAPDFEIKFLRNLGRGNYEFVGFNWKTADNIKITWSPTSSNDFNSRTFTVGHYRNVRYEWDFKELTKFL